MMQATLNLISGLKNKKIVEVQTAKETYGHLCDIAMVLYERIIKRLVEFIDFDCATAVLTLECFLLIFNVINNQFKSNFKSFLTRVGTN